MRTVATEALRARPMLRTVLGKTIREQRRALMWWGIGLFASGATYAPFYPSIKDNADVLEKYMDSMPEFLREAFMGASGDFTSPAGYLNTELFNFFAPLLLLLFAIGAGARAIAGEEERQTLDILLSTPIARRRVIIDKFVAMLLAGALLSAARADDERHRLGRLRGAGGDRRGRVRRRARPVRTSGPRCVAESRAPGRARPRARRPATGSPAPTLART